MCLPAFLSLKTVFIATFLFCTLGNMSYSRGECRSERQNIQKRIYFPSDITKLWSLTQHIPDLLSNNPKHGLVPGYVGIVTSDAQSGFHGLKISVKTLVDSPCIRSSAGFSVFAAVHVNEREKEWGIVFIAFYRNDKKSPLATFCMKETWIKLMLSHLTWHMRN